MSLSFSFDDSGLFKTSSESGFGLSANSSQINRNDSGIFIHWYDSLVAFDTFDSLGSSGDKWTYSKGSASYSDITVSSGSLNIKHSAIDEDVGDSMYFYNTNVLKSGKFYYNGSTNFNCRSTGTVYFQIFVGNSTDGFTLITEFSTYSSVTTNYNNAFLLEGIYNGGHKWNIYLNNELISSELSKINGVQIKFVTSSVFSSGISPTFNLFVKDVYFSEV